MTGVSWSPNLVKEVILVTQTRTPTAERGFLSTNKFKFKSVRWLEIIGQKFRARIFIWREQRERGEKRNVARKVLPVQSPKPIESTLTPSCKGRTPRASNILFNITNSWPTSGKSPAGMSRDLGEAGWKNRAGAVDDTYSVLGASHSKRLSGRWSRNWRLNHAGPVLPNDSALGAVEIEVSPRLGNLPSITAQQARAATNDSKESHHARTRELFPTTRPSG